MRDLRSYVNGKSWLGRDNVRIGKGSCESWDLSEGQERIMLGISEGYVRDSWKREG